MKDKKIAIIGAGDLGSRVLEALYLNGHRRIVATRNDKDKLDELKEDHPGIEITVDNKVAVDYSDITILGVKPPKIKEVASEIKDYAADKLVISIAAATSIEYIENILDKSRVARVMTGLNVSKEVAGYSLGSKCTEDDEAQIKYIFRSAIEIDEAQMPLRTAYACDTGLLALRMGVIADTMRESGLPENAIREFSAGVLEGVAADLRSGKTEIEIYESVAGPNSFTGRMADKLSGKGQYCTLKECFKQAIEDLTPKES